MGKKVRRERPLGVTIIGVLLLIYGLFMIVGGISVGALGGGDALSLAIEGISLVMGVIYLVAAFGFFKGWGWVWLVTMVVVIVGMIWSVASWALDGLDMGRLGSLLIGLLIPIIIVLYMNSSGVKAFFRRR
ncbi:MAG: hypothetical protein GXY70_03175 [Euryarchaeota archaeon]|nr:hypothetical protein [Euryarchaeota archaeon]